ncbi:MAG: hypothetical protein ACOWWM_19115 [Desulfobacterales bacterium]
MSSMDEQILRAAKEIVVKFIETGRISPTGFTDAFRSVYDTIADTVNRREADSDATPPKG